MKRPPSVERTLLYRAESSTRVRGPKRPAAVLALAFIRVAVAYLLGVSIFYALELVANLVTHQSDGPWHAAVFGVLLALASLTLLASMLQTDASRFSRSFGVMTAVMLVGFWALRHEPSVHVDAPLVYAQQHIISPLSRQFHIR